MAIAPHILRRSILPKGLMRAHVFRSPGIFGVDQKSVPHAGPGDAIVRVRLTSICDADLRIVRGEYPVRSGLTLGHEAVGQIHQLGQYLTGFEPGQRVLISALTPCGQCELCLSGDLCHCGGPLGAWRLGHMIDGTQADYVRVPFAQVNLAPIPDSLSDESVLLLSDSATTGFAAAENGRVRLGDTVAVIGQDPLGLCATLGAKLMGAAEIFAVDPDHERLRMAAGFGATTIIGDPQDPVRTILAATGGRGVDVVIDATGAGAGRRVAPDGSDVPQRVLRSGGTLSSIAACAGHLDHISGMPPTSIDDRRSVSTLCPGGKARMARLMRLVLSSRVDLTPLLTHLFSLDDIEKAYELLASRRDNVLKVAIRVS